MESTESSGLRKEARVLWLFFVHVVMGSITFVLVAAPAVALDFGIKWLDTLSVDSIVLYGIKGVKYLLFFADVALFVVFIVRATWRSAKEV